MQRRVKSPKRYVESSVLGLPFSFNTEVVDVVVSVEEDEMFVVEMADDDDDDKGAFV